MLSSDIVTSATRMLMMALRRDFGGVASPAALVSFDDDTPARVSRHILWVSQSSRMPPARVSPTISRST
jgi:hypothetical protein